MANFGRDGIGKGSALLVVAYLISIDPGFFLNKIIVLRKNLVSSGKKTSISGPD